MSSELTTRIGGVITEKEIVDENEVFSILGIPYATAGRFDDPVMIESYGNSPINHGKGLRFPQNDVPPLMNVFLKNPMMRPELLTNADTTDENAFVLNIWTSGLEEKKPVLVFIHGGGFTYGSGTTPLYNGKYLASKGIVVVTINYRLGIPGFFPIDKNGTLSANRGYYDQQCALRWVKKNIECFGGDSENITLMGQSAGGMSAFTQMMNKDSQKLFEKLIVCSAGVPRCVPADEARKNSAKLLSAAGITDWHRLAEMPYQKLLKVKIPLGMTSTPVIDGRLFEKPALDMLLAGEYDAKPVFIGSTGNEMEMINNKSWHKSMGIVKDEAALEKKCNEIYGKAGTAFINALRPESASIPELQFKLIEVVMFHASTLRSLECFSAKTAAFGFRMNYVPNAWNGLRKSYHCADLPFIFGTIRDMDYTPSPDNLIQVKNMQDDIISFLNDGTIAGKSPYNDKEQIIWYEGTTSTMKDFPHAGLIREARDTDAFENIKDDFMRGRDMNFVA